MSALSVFFCTVITWCYGWSVVCYKCK